MQERNQKGSFSIDGLQKQFDQKESLIAAIENFMLSNWDEIEDTRGNNDYSNIATKALGYALADEEMKKQLIELFNTIEKYIRENISEPNQRKVYGRTLYGINSARSIEAWYGENSIRIKEAETTEELLNIIWDYMRLDVCSETRLKITNIELFKTIVLSWIGGTSYSELLKLFTAS
jgi:hypothetical protein